MKNGSAEPFLVAREMRTLFRLIQTLLFFTEKYMLRRDEMYI